MYFSHRFPREMKNFCTNWEFAFWQTSTTLSRQILQNDFFVGVVANTIQISSFNDNDAFNQSDLNTFLS